jgi:Holliday junction resolvase
VDLTDFSKVTRIRRQRGWKWEDTLVKRLNDSHSWEAYRIGGSSTDLPDILAISNKLASVMVIEAKSGTTDRLIINRDQIERSFRFLNTFKRYTKRVLIIAFKFSRKKRLNNKTFKKRELREYYKLINIKIEEIKEIPFIVCHYDRGCPVLPDFKMPFMQ